MRLRAAPGRTRLVPEPHGETPAWCYNGQVPGPEIRVRQGDRLRVHVENSLEEETTVHWHGLRVPNAMDGVPHLTQTPRSEEHTSELQSLMRISYAVFCLKKNTYITLYSVSPQLLDTTNSLLQVLRHYHLHHTLHEH